MVYILLLQIQTTAIQTIQTQHRKPCEPRARPARGAGAALDAAARAARAELAAAERADEAVGALARARARTVVGHVQPEAHAAAAGPLAARGISLRSRIFTHRVLGVGGSDQRFPLVSSCRSNQPPTKGTLTPKTLVLAPPGKLD